MVGTTQGWWIYGLIVGIAGLATLFMLRRPSRRRDTDEECQAPTSFASPERRILPSAETTSANEQNDSIVWAQRFEAHGLSFAVEATSSTVDSNDYVDYHYEAFVQEQWAKSGIDLRSYSLIRLTDDGPRFYTLHSLVEPGYLNCLEGGRRKSFVPERHRWMLNDVEVEPIAFTAMMKGVPPALALLPDPRPSTPEEAIAKDRLSTEERRILLNYRSASGEESFRIISRPSRSASGFTARCHFRYGLRRDFRFERVLSLANAQTGEMIEPAALFRGNRQKKK